MELKLWYTEDFSVPNFLLPKTQNVFQKICYLFIFNEEYESANICSFKRIQ